MLNIAVIALAAAAAASSPVLTPTAPWWEKITVTVDADGKQQSCRYETSLAVALDQPCGSSDAAAVVERASATSGVQTKITFERRFTPGEMPDVGELAAGDTLLGGQVMMLAIDGEGAVRACQTVVESGNAKTEYSCDDVRAERFEASAGVSSGQARLGFMTILVYGHEEKVA